LYTNFHCLVQLSVPGSPQRIARSHFDDIRLHDHDSIV